MADARRLVIESYLALERAGEIPTMNRAIAMARAAGGVFRTESARAWLRPFQDGARPGRTDSPAHPESDAEPSSLYRARPEVSPDCAPGAGVAALHARAAKESLVSNYGGGSTRAEIARAFCVRAFQAILDAGLSDPDNARPEPWVNANQEAAERLIHGLGEGEAFERWTKSLDDAKVGHLRKHDFSLAFLIRLGSARRTMARAAADAGSDSIRKRSGAIG